MSGQQAGTAIGFVAGFFLPGGPQVWAGIGGFIGGAVDPTKVQGPRLSDGMEVTAADGIPNTWGFGTFANGGNIINSFDLQEHSHTDDGKGSGMEQETFSYTRSYAIAICRAKRRTDGLYDPIAGVLRATHNGKVVYNTQPDATPEQLAQNSKFLETFKFYLGGEDQLPDPTLESYRGVGDVSAYRGEVYMVATDEDQTQSGGSIGTWEFVVAMDGTTHQVALSDEITAPLKGEFVDAHWPLGTDLGFVYTYGAFSSTSLEDALQAARADTGLSLSHYIAYTAYPAGGGSAPPSDLQGDQWGTETPETGTVVTLTYSDWPVVGALPIGETDCESLPQDLSGRDYYLGATPLAVKRRTVPPAHPDETFHYNNCVSTEPYTVVVGPGQAQITVTKAKYCAVPDATPIGDAPGWGVDSGGNVVPLLPSEYNDEGSTYLALAYDAGDDEITGPILDESDPDNTEAFWTAAAIAAGIPGDYGVDFPVNVEGVCVPSTAAVGSLVVEGVLLATIVAEICRRSGLEDDDFEVSELTDVVAGFKVAIETTGESLIQTLQQGFFFDSGEWDDKLRFIKRGGDVQAELTFDDLCERDGPAIEETEVQEVELLRKVHVKSMDPAAGYVETTQTWERRSSTVAAEGEQTIHLPIVADNDTQAQIGEKRGKVAWSETRQSAFDLPYTMPQYTPTDRVGLTDRNGRRQRLRLMEMSEDTGRIQIKEARLDRQSSYTSDVQGVVHGPPTDTSPGLIGPTYLWVGNLPSLRTQDNVPGMYFAGCGYLRAWGGYVLLMSVDGGESFQQVALVHQAATMGTLTAGVSPSGEPISVFMNYGTVSSITDAQLANRMNAFAITSDLVNGPSELGQFKTATIDSGQTFDLTDTVRGGLGTTPATHFTGDPFVMVATATFLPIDISHAGKILIFKAVSIGTSADDTPEYPVKYNPLFTSITVSPLTEDGVNITVDGAPIYVVTTNA